MCKLEELLQFVLHNHFLNLLLFPSNMLSQKMFGTNAKL